MKNLNSYVVILTGAAGGLGREFTGQLLDQGANLILTDYDGEQIQKLIDDFGNQRQGRILGGFVADLSDPIGAEMVYSEALKLSTHVDMIINNAGVAHAGEFANIPDVKWEASMQINLMSPMRLCHHFLPMMKARRKGHIVNISSVAGYVALPGGAPYTATKHGLLGFSNSIRIEYEKYGIKVSTVHPFFTKTAILNSERFDITMSSKQVPDFLQEDPREVVREVIEGVREERDMIMPGAVSKTLEMTRRYFPDLLKLINNIL